MPLTTYEACLPMLANAPWLNLIFEISNTFEKFKICLPKQAHPNSLFSYQTRMEIMHAAKQRHGSKRSIMKCQHESFAVPFLPKIPALLRGPKKHVWCAVLWKQLPCIRRQKKTEKLRSHMLVIFNFRPLVKQKTHAKCFFGFLKEIFEEPTGNTPSAVACMGDAATVCSSKRSIGELENASLARAILNQQPT